MKHTEIIKSITTMTTWRVKDTKERVEFQSEDNAFYVWDANNALCASFPLSDAKLTLDLCDAAVLNDRHTLTISPTDTIPNTSFLSMVLTQFLHKLNTTHNDESHN
jgi:tRNA splicing endonuclease